MKKTNERRRTGPHNHDVIGSNLGPRGPFGGEAGRSQACGAGLAKGRQAGLLAIEGRQPTRDVEVNADEQASSLLD